MKVKISMVLKDVKGDSLMQPTETGKKELLNVKTILASALFNMNPDDKVSGQEKYERGKLAEKIMTAVKEVELSVDEITKIKKLVGESYSPLIVWQIWDLLDPKPNAEK